MLRDRDRVLLAEVVGDDGRDSASRAMLVAFAPDLVLEIPRFRADATDAATDRNLFAIVQLAFVRKVDGGLDDPVTAVDRYVHDLREIFGAHHLRPANIGDIIRVLHHVDVRKRYAKARNERKIIEHRAQLRRVPLKSAPQRRLGRVTRRRGQKRPVAGEGA